MSVELHQVMFFSDLRDFSVTSEKLSNVELFAWLQRYIGLMSSIVARHNGTIVNWVVQGHDDRQVLMLLRLSFGSKTLSHH